MAERVCEEGTQVTQEPAGPDYTTWGQVWDDMRDEEWYADSFRPGGRCHFPRVADQALEKAQALTDFWYDLGYHQTQEEDDLVEHVVLVEAPRHDPQALLGTMAPMNNWHEAGRSWCDSRHIFQRDRHAPATLVRRQHRLLRRQVHMALAQVA